MNVKITKIHGIKEGAPQKSPKAFAETPYMAVNIYGVKYPFFKTVPEQQKAKCLFRPV